MAGRGTKSLIIPQYPVLATGVHSMRHPRVGEQRMVIGNCRLLSEEGVVISR